MKKFIDSKLRGIQKESYAAGPMEVSSFLELNASMSSDDNDRREVAGESGIGQEDEEARPSNEYVLNVAFFSFFGFMMIQAVFAIIANSEAMLADCEAMAVDALTYLFNLCAERIKHRPFTEKELSLPKAMRDRQRSKLRLYLELFPPLISVVTLITVTIITLGEAFGTLFGEGEAEPEDVDIWIMLIFSGGNLLLDVVNVFCFARADQAFGLPAMSQRHVRDLVRMTSKGAEVVHNDDEDHYASENTPLVIGGRDKGIERMESCFPEDQTYGVNLNMCSAWTHVCADTLRSTAVLIAAFIAAVFQQVEGVTADAAAAVVVSIIILVSLLPLLHGLYLTAKEIVILHRTPISMDV